MEHGLGLMSQILALMAVAVLVTVAAQRSHLPYTIAVVLTGLGVSFLSTRPEFTRVTVHPELILGVFLPGLLFEAAYHLDLKRLRDNSLMIMSLAIGGTLISAGVIGVILSYALGMSLAEALLFGVLISATDPVAVISIFKELGVNKRLRIIAEGESMLNDGVSIVLFGILISSIVDGTPITIAGVTSAFFVTVAGGAVLGLITGVIAGELVRRSENHLVDLALTVILAYGTYVIAEGLLHGAVSPVIAVVVAGLYVGNYQDRAMYSAKTSITIVMFWEFVVFLINSAVFLLIGMTIEPTDFIQYAIPLAITIVVVLFARAVIVYPLGTFVNLKKKNVPGKWNHVLFWGGLRGAVSMALVLSLPEELEAGGLIKVLAFGYVLFSLLVQGLTIRPLLRKLDIIKISQYRQEYEERRAEMVIARSALDAIDHLRESHTLTGPVCDFLQQVYEGQMDDRWNEVRDLISRDPQLAKRDIRLAQREIATHQKKALLNQMRQGLLSQESYEKLEEKVDQWLAETYDPGWEPPLVLNRAREMQLDSIVGLELVELTLADADAAVGQSVRDLSKHLPEECLLVSIRRNGIVLIPRGTTIFQPGDLVTALVDQQNLNVFHQTLRNPS
ncbi:MAG: Na+/H+ antiporter [Anaerolineae bacterium]|nr:Na+/H+ antiporter [Anaerolineae bacterium]